MNLQRWRESLWGSVWGLSGEFAGQQPQNNILRINLIIVINQWLSIVNVNQWLRLTYSIPPSPDLRQCKFAVITPVDYQEDTVNLLMLHLLKCRLFFLQLDKCSQTLAQSFESRRGMGVIYRAQNLSRPTHCEMKIILGRTCQTTAP